MIILSGKAVCSGINFGKVSLYTRDSFTVKRRHVEDIEAETMRYNKAKTEAIDELELLYYKATKEIGEAEAQIFSIHRMMLEDIDYNESVMNIITKQRLNAETAVLMTADSFSKMFSDMDDTYMQARASDVRDVSDRIIGILSGEERHEFTADGDNIIIFADDLAPSETLQMDKEKITAFVTEKGSATSHTAILARSLSIPAIIGIKSIVKEEYDGKFAAVDGYTGRVYIEPTEEIMKELSAKKNEKDEQRELLKELKDKPTVTVDGKKIKLYANIGTTADLGNVILNDAEGIGLFRSEFLYLESEDFPTEDMQFEAYKKIAEGMGEKPVIIRTLDIGADKKIDYFKLPEEENPALGMRAIRICLTRRDIFKTQLRAILRASAFGNIMIMLPMIVSLKEIQDAKAIINEAKAELDEAKIPYAKDLQVGIMIETPAAAIISDILAEESDFFSIGTNDLTQYLLAMDRQNEDVAEMMDTHHEAILRTIKMVIENAHKKGIWAGICGELGSDSELIPKFLKMGIDELSVTCGKVLEVRKIVRESYSKN
ncbi:MAG: phosphoenolpyruvate--protein phosphotransferase [Clostridia bacterium]|nr:phosphoenolpyruvate--protein phosphotransferase [Clostridia bacterium]